MKEILTVLGYALISCVSFALLIGGIYGFYATIRDMILND